MFLFWTETYLAIYYPFQLGGGYLFGLPVGFFADSIGATLGAGAAFLLGRTVRFFYSTRVILF